MKDFLSDTPQKWHPVKWNVKNTILYFLFLIPLLASCVNFTDDVFDRSAADRINESLATYRQLLTTQTNGWIMEYFPEKTQKYGGFNLYFRFETENVTVRSETGSAISTWSMGTDMGPTINFDTYNTILHYFSDPGLNVGAGYGLSYEGDYEFFIESGSKDEFILRGKKTKNIIRMTPLPANITVNDYFQSIDEMDQNVIAPAYRMTVGGREIPIVRVGRTNVFALKENESSKETISASFIVTPVGIKFYEPVTIAGETFQTFTYRADHDKIISDQGNAEISVLVVPLSKYFIDGLAFTDWYLKTDNIGQGYLSAWNTAKNNLLQYLGYSFKLAYAWLGALDIDYPAGVSIGVWDEEDGIVYGGTYVYDFEIVSDDRIKFNYNPAKTNADGINASFFSGAVSGFTVNAFNGRTFALVPDQDITNPKNVVRINELTLIDIANSDNWIKIGLETVLWP